MWSIFIASVLLAPFSLAARVSARLDERDVRDDFGLQWISKDPTLPKVVLYNTGGTIVSNSNYSRLDNVNYGHGPGTTAQDLLSNYSEIVDLAQIAVVTFRGSSENSTLFYNVSKLANLHLCSSQSEIAGAVMLHGTNTLEETIFGLDLTVNCSKPIIATGAMRPESYISHDGPSNFYQAVATAIDPHARDRGALIVFNDRIVSAFYATKANANTPDTFQAVEQGFLGACLAGQPYWYFGPSYPVGRNHFDISSMSSGDELPAVVILFGHQGFDPSLIYAAVSNGAKGVVIAAAGAGSLNDETITIAGILKEQGIPVVASTRPMAGAAPPRLYQYNFISSGYMGPGKARIQLQLCLATGMGWEGCRDVFERDARAAIYDSVTVGSIPRPPSLRLSNALNLH